MLSKRGKDPGLKGLDCRGFQQGMMSMNKGVILLITCIVFVCGSFVLATVTAKTIQFMVQVVMTHSLPRSAVGATKSRK